jgi:hypothetical protein
MVLEDDDGRTTLHTGPRPFMTIYYDRGALPTASGTMLLAGSGDLSCRDLIQALQTNVRKRAERPSRGSPWIDFEPTFVNLYPL